MMLELQRILKEPEYTIGVFRWNGSPLCYCIEDAIRAEKVYGKTAIPAGIYEIRLTMSARFKRVLPELFNVPNYTGIRIHTGNTAANTEGCLLPGMVAAIGAVRESKIAFDLLLPKIETALKQAPLHIRIH
jgi:hypothetical protein